MSRNLLKPFKLPINLHYNLKIGKIYSQPLHLTTHFDNVNENGGYHSESKLFHAFSYHIPYEK